MARIGGLGKVGKGVLVLWRECFLTAGVARLGKRAAIWVGVGSRAPGEIKRQAFFFFFFGNICAGLYACTTMIGAFRFLIVLPKVVMPTTSSRIGSLEPDCCQLDRQRRRAFGGRFLALVSSYHHGQGPH